jgi:hypothetical protein
VWCSARIDDCGEPRNRGDIAHVQKKTLLPTKIHLMVIISPHILKE